MMLMSSQLGSPTSSTTRLLDARPIYSKLYGCRLLGCRAVWCVQWRKNTETLTGDLAQDNDNMYNFKLFISFRQYKSLKG